MAQADAAMATALIRGWMPSRMRRVMRDDHPGVTIRHMVGTVLRAVIGHLGRGRGHGGERERPGHAERKLQEQHCAESPSSRAQSHGESLHRGFRTGKLRGHTLRLHQRRTSLSRSALPMTDTELKLIAAAAMMGLRSNPKTG